MIASPGSAGTCRASIPVARLSSSVPTCVPVPIPVEPNLRARPRRPPVVQDRHTITSILVARRHGRGDDRPSRRRRNDAYHRHPAGLLLARTTAPFEPMSKRRRGFPSEARGKAGGDRTLRGGDVELVEKLGNNDPCPCGSDRRFQALLSQQRQARRRRTALLRPRLTPDRADHPDRRGPRGSLDRRPARDAAPRDCESAVQVGLAPLLRLRSFAALMQWCGRRRLRCGSRLRRSPRRDGSAAPCGRRPRRSPGARRARPVRRARLPGARLPGSSRRAG